jgi:hypothetical protein
MKKKNVNTVQLKIVLEYIKPQIWRRVLVPDNFSLADLHNMVQFVMGWHSCHLHCFEIDGISYTFREQADDLEMEDENRLLLSDIIQSGVQEFSYLYDFGDSWLHQITIEKTTPIEPGQARPACLAGARACPPEDCGSDAGYEELLYALAADEPDEEQQDLLEWLDSYAPGWDPDFFDPEAINQALQS